MSPLLPDLLTIGMQVVLGGLKRTGYIEVTTELFVVGMQVALGILKRTGYSEVTTVVDGQQAMDELHRRGGADAFDVILTDLHMPHKVRLGNCQLACL